MKPSQLLLLFICCLLSAGLAIVIDRIIPNQNALTTHVAEQEKFTGADAVVAGPNFTKAAQLVTPAVVFLKAYPASISHLEPSLRHATTGSGVIIDEEGLIVTNRHVIKDAVRLRVVLGDKREFDAEIVGVDQATDIALLKINDSQPFPKLTFGDSDSLKVGEWVIAVGNPFSLNSTVTAGIVSGKGRSIDVLEPEDRIESFIQTDAAVNPGNSGGALVTTDGALVGINTAILSESGRDEGFAFAVPGNLVLRVINDLVAYGEVRRAVIGAYVQSVNAAQANALGMDNAQGVLITGLKPNGPASRAGLIVDDVMLKFNGISINSPAELQEQLSKYLPGERIKIDYSRRGKVGSVAILLRDKNNETKKLVSGKQ